jgi:hypothetical protein
VKAVAEAQAEISRRHPNTTHRFVGENEAVVPWPRVTGRPAHRAARPLRLDGALVGAMPTAGADGNRAGVLRSRRTARHYSPQHLVIAQRGSRPFRTVSRATASRSRATTSTSTVVANPAFAPVAQLVEHLFCKQAVRGSTPRSGSSARPVFVARVRAEQLSNGSCA